MTVGKLSMAFFFFFVVAVMALTAFYAGPASAIACGVERDFVCPAPGCLGGDPDCCDGSATYSCDQGFYCDVASGTCLSRSGQACRTQADCSGDTYCSVDAGLCVSRHFIFVKPDTLKVKVGSEPVLRVTVFDPANRTGTYKLSVSDTGSKYFARFFGTQNAVSITLKPREANTIPLHFSAGAIGNYQLKVQIVDSVYDSDATSSGNPAGIVGLSDTVNLEVFSETSAPLINVVSAPGPSAFQLLLLLGLGAFVFFLL